MPTSSSSKARQSFDYASLDAETSQFVQQQTGEIRGLMKQTAQGIVEIGQRLIQVKERLGHGRFLDWLEAEFDWNRRTAHRCMSVAEQFGSNWDKLSHLNLAPSALYVLAAPSTPAAVRSEVLARAYAGELITHKTAKVLKQKYASPPTQPTPEPVSPPQPSPMPISQPGQKLEIVAIRSQVKAPVPEAAPKPILSQAAQSQNVPQPSQSVFTPDVPGVWWQLGGQHLLYCGHPNSDEFLARIPEVVQLLLAFPPNRIWQSRITSEARIILTDYLPIFRNPEKLDEAIEPLILNHSRLGDLVVICFLPSPDILSILNRLNRRGVIAESNFGRSKAVISDWKRAGLKAERLG